MDERDERQDERQEEQSQEVDESGQDVSTGANDESAAASRKSGDAVTLDDARDLANQTLDVIDGYENKRDTAYKDIADKLVTLDDNDKKILENTSKDATKSGAEQTVYVCKLEQTQYDALDYCYHYAQGAASVMLFLLLVNTLMVSALFGNRLWASFSKGWRK